MTNENKIKVLEARKQLLYARDPVANAKIIKKIMRKINKYKED